MNDICPTCGAVLEVGAWPFCRGTADSHAPGRPAVVADEVPGGFWQENGFREPRKFYSKSERDRALAEKGLEIRVRHVPVPGSDRSPHTVDWSKGSMDAQTLENARVLLSRGRRVSDPRPEDDPDYGPPIPITVTEGAPLRVRVEYD